MYADTPTLTTSTNLYSDLSGNGWDTIASSGIKSGNNYFYCLDTNQSYYVSGFTSNAAMIVGGVNTCSTKTIVSIILQYYITSGVGLHIYATASQAVDDDITVYFNYSISTLSGSLSGSTLVTILNGNTDSNTANFASGVDVISMEITSISPTSSSTQTYTY